MNKKSQYAFLFILSLFGLVTGEILFLKEFKSASEESISKKNSFVKATGLPDLAFYTETSYVRHRSLSDPFSIYGEDGSLRERSKSTFVTNVRQPFNYKSVND